MNKSFLAYLLFYLIINNFLIVKLGNDIVYYNFMTFSNFYILFFEGNSSS